MLRLSVDYTTDPNTIGPGFGDYVDAMTGHCPFLRPSLQRSLTHWLCYETNATIHQLADLQREIFAAAVEHMELLRAQRRVRLSSDAVLLCTNIAIRWIAVQDATAHRRALAWPHWMLKTVYTPLGYMVGKFGLHAQGADRRGRQVPPVPLSFLSLRIAVQRKDPQFLHETPHIAEQLAAAHDQGQNPFAHIPDLADIPLTRCALRTPESYLRVNAWARAQIPGGGSLATATLAR
ncbi:MAG: hypothetical protein M3460_02350 [Actinomycetota bacterium]|nr:hypothetical protein [Actinomycetota bacterium]